MGKFTARVVAGYVLSIVIGFAIYLSIFDRIWGRGLVTKAVGARQACPWGKLLTMPWSFARLGELQKEALARLTKKQEDSNLGIALIQSPTRQFWISTRGNFLDGVHTLAYIIAEQQWITELTQDHGVRSGDVVVDVGAHIGTFGDDALRRGASRVIMIEPDPINLECIRRNFRKEIAQGTVLVIPEGAWSKLDVLEFDTGVANSGTGSFVVNEVGSRKIKIPVRPLDDMLRSAGVGRVDFIKMDIEGAEREAIKGAGRTLAKWKPRLMLDSYHLVDDDIVLPAAILAANPGYRAFCAACSINPEADSKRIIPYAVFYE